MEILLTSLTASLTELCEPNKVIAKAGNQPIAILNGNEVIGYFVPRSAVASIELVEVSDCHVAEFLDNQLPKITPVLDYLKDK